jgi:hypothetical protein
MTAEEPSVAIPAPKVVACEIEAHQRPIIGEDIRDVNLGYQGYGYGTL